MFKRLSGKVKAEHFNKTASTAFEIGTFLGYSLATGLLVVAGSEDSTLAGINNRAIDSSTVNFVGTSDYATTSELEFDNVFEAEDLIEADVTGASLALTDVGNYYGIATNGKSVLLTDTTNKNFLCVGVISTTKGIFKAVGRDSDV